MTQTTATRTGRYHGSLLSFHGPVRVLDECDCEACWDEYDFARLTGAPKPATRWELVTADGHLLQHVRRESFTLDGDAS